METKKLAKVLLILLAIVTLSISSELVYYLNQKGLPYLIPTYYVARAKLALRYSNLETSLTFLERGAYYEIKSKSQYFPNLTPDQYSTQINLSNDNQALSTAFSSYISKLDLLAFPKKADLSQVYYSLAILAYRNSEEDLVYPLLQTAANINPDLSHLQIELANYYLAIGERKKAEDQIKTCLGFDNSYRHCKEYNDTLFNEGVIQEIGFQEKELEKYFKSK